MPRSGRLRDYLMRRDGRNPYGSRGGYVDTRNPYGSRGGYVDSRRGRGMDYAYDRRDYRGSDYEYDSRRGDRAYSEQDNARGRRDYESNGQSDMARGDYADMNRHYIRGDYNNEMDGHYSRGGSTYFPIEAMGTFNGYYGMPEDYARGGRRDYRSDYRSDYGYDYAGDYGETLSHKEIEKWNKKLMKEVEEKDKQFFSKESISRKAQQMGIKFDKYNEEELAVATAMMYTDYCMALKPFVGANMDVYVKLADAFLNDKDAAVKGGEKLAIYHDCIVEDKEEDDD